MVEANTTVAEKSELFNRPGRHCSNMAVTAIISPVLLCELCGKASKHAKTKKKPVESLKASGLAWFRNYSIYYIETIAFTQ